MKVCCDDTVWLENGLPGIVVGYGHGRVAVLWRNGRVTRVPEEWIVFRLPCP